MTPTAEALADECSPQSVSGVRLDDGEIVLLAMREHWSVPARWGGAPTLLLLIFLWTLSSGRPSPMPTNLQTTLMALALAPLVASLLRHFARRYVLTDRRVIVRYGRDCRWVALGAVTDIRTSAGAGRVGDVVFRSARGVLVWQRVSDASGVAELAREAVSRYGRG